MFVKSKQKQIVHKLELDLNKKGKAMRHGFSASVKEVSKRMLSQSRASQRKLMKSRMKPLRK